MPPWQCLQVIKRWVRAISPRKELPGGGDFWFPEDGFSFALTQRFF